MAAETRVDPSVRAGQPQGGEDSKRMGTGEVCGIASEVQARPWKQQCDHCPH